jgi:hypothetical protein
VIALRAASGLQGDVSFDVIALRAASGLQGDVSFDVNHTGRCATPNNDGSVIQEC